LPGRLHCGMARIPRRLGALFLLVFFVGGGPGLPDLDALLFHSHVEVVRANVAHVDLPGGCGAHTERCALGAVLSGPQLAGFGVVKVHGDLVASRTAGFQPTLALHSADRSFLHPSRAPPAPAC
jgi:hypothetical protein